MKLKHKILVGYGVVFILMVMVVAWSVLNLVALRRATSFISLNNRSLIAVEQMLDALDRQDAGILMMFLGDDKMGRTSFRENEIEFSELLGVAKASMRLEGGNELIRQLDSDYASYRRQFDSISEPANAENLFSSSLAFYQETSLSLVLKSGDTVKLRSSSPLAIYQESVLPLFIKVRETCEDLRDMNEQAINDATVSAGNVAVRAIWSTLIVAVSGLIAVLFLSLLLAGRIVRPLHLVMEAARKISSGDYSVDVKVDTNDELGSLAGEFNKMARQLGRYREMDIENIINEKNKNESIISSIDDGLVVFDTDLRVTGINPAARKILGLEFKDTVSVQCADIIPDANLCEFIRKTVETGLKPQDIPDESRIIVLKQGGKSYHYMFSIAITKGRDEGNLSGIVLLLRDITRLKEVERFKNDFVMAASHQLRTPLTSVGMSIDLLLEHVAPKLAVREKDLIQTAYEEVQRMKALVNDLLDLSKMEAGKINLELENIPLQYIFDQMRDVFKNQIEMKNIILSSTLSADLSGVRADENKITWVLTNLISNALRYVRAGGHISLLANKIGAYVHVSVNDDGPGIPLEYQSKIFDKFVQVKGQESGGTGLGLAICKEIVRAHRGTIWVESTPGHGSTFTFTLPVAQ